MHYNIFLITCRSLKKIHYGKNTQCWQQQPCWKPFTASVNLVQFLSASGQKKLYSVMQLPSETRILAFRSPNLAQSLTLTANFSAFFPSFSVSASFPFLHNFVRGYCSWKENWKIKILFFEYQRDIYQHHIMSNIKRGSAAFFIASCSLSVCYLRRKYIRRLFDFQPLGNSAGKKYHK